MENKELSLKEVKEIKSKAEESIFNILVGLQDYTKCKVSDLRLEYLELFDEDNELVDLETKVKIDLEILD